MVKKTSRNPSIFEFHKNKTCTVLLMAFTGVLSTYQNINDTPYTVYSKPVT